MNGLRRIAIGGLLVALAALPVAAAKAPAPKHANRAHAAARGRSGAPADTSPVLVRIGNDVITRAMVQQRLDEIPEGVRGQYETPDGREQLLERLTEEKVWMVTAMKAGVADREQLKKQLEQQRRDLIIRTYLTEAMAGNPAPSDSDAKVYYDAHLADYKVPATVTVRHLQTKTEAEARRLLPQARAKGADFQALVKKFSTDSVTKATGGLLGTVTRDGVFGSLGSQPTLAESVFALPQGAIGGPYKTTKGWSLVQVESKKDEGTRSFDQVRPLIMRQLTSQRSQEYYRTLLDKARRDLGVKSDSAAIKDFVSAKKSARDLFKDAQEAGPADQRLALYRQLLEQYPDADVAPQAQFMIGFINSEELKNYEEAERAFKALLARYPKSELSASAQWMIAHMRSDDAPPMLQLDASGPHAVTPADTARAGASHAPGQETSIKP